jgi:hypothetical protein
MVVPARSLDSIQRENGHDQIDVLKIDIEGAEVQVLAELLVRRPSALPSVIFVDFDSVCCCFGAGCAEKKQAGLAMISRLQAAGYEGLQKGKADWTFIRRQAVS